MLIVKKTFIIHHLPNISLLCNQVTLNNFCLPEEIPCCPTVFPMKKVIIRGTRTSFTCKVDIKNSIPKYLVFKWYRQEKGTYVEVPSSETYRHNDSASVLMIENAKATPKTGILYKCQTLYKGRKSDSNGPHLVVHGRFEITYCSLTWFSFLCLWLLPSLTSPYSYTRNLVLRTLLTF